MTITDILAKSKNVLQLPLNTFTKYKVIFRFTLKTPQSGTLLSLKHQVKMTKRSPLSPLLLKAKVK